MKKSFPFLILISALFISVTGSVFSIYGLGKLFGGHQLGATILAFAFEFGNIVTAASLKLYWKYLPIVLKFPLILIVIVLTILTSMGIYGYLSDGYQKTALKDEIVTKRSNLVKIKKQNFETRVDDNKKELTSISNNLEELSKSYNQNSQTQKMVNGQLVTNVFVSSKKGLDQQMNLLNNRKIKLDSINSIYLDSIQKLELQIIEIENSNEVQSELGPLKYLSNLTGQPMNKIVNWLILLIVIVFQPLALLLIVTSMFAFKNNHYVTRGSRHKNNAFPDLKGWFKKPVNPININSQSESEETFVPEITNEPKKKRNRKSTVKVETSNPNVPSESEEEPTPKTETEVEEPKKRKRKVINSQLTPELVEHITKTLSDKKKV